MSRFLSITLILCVAMLQVGCLVTVRNQGPNPIVIDFDVNPLFESPAPLAPGFNRTYLFLQAVEVVCTATDPTTNETDSTGMEAEEVQNGVVLEWDGQLLEIVD